MINFIFWLIWGVILLVASIASYSVESLLDYDISAHITFLHMCVGFACAKFLEASYLAGCEVAQKLKDIEETQNKDY